MNNTIKFSVDTQNSGKRLDVFLKENIKNYTRSFLKKLIENKHVKIRLSYIDAPELRQAFGVRSKNYLTNLVLDKKVQIDTYRKDRYNRIIGEVYIHDDKGSIFVNAKLIKSGNAWVYKRYRNNRYLINLEDYAKTNNNGLWSTKNPLEPWEYRKK